MHVRNLARNAVIAALYGAIALVLPATALANWRLATALYALAAWNPALIPGLAIGNAIGGITQGPIDILFGAVVGVLTAWACAKLGPRWAPLAILVIPTAVVPLWLSLLLHVPYPVVVLVVLQGQAVSAVLAVVLLQLKGLRRVVTG